MLGSTGFVGWDCRRFGFGICWEFHILNFFLFSKLLTSCGIRNFFDYGLVWEWMSWLLCWVSILWMVWFVCGFMWVFMFLLLFKLFDLVMFMFFYSRFAF